MVFSSNPVSARTRLLALCLLTFACRSYSQEVIGNLRGVLQFHVQPEIGKAIVVQSNQYQLIDLKSGKKEAFPSPGIGRRAARNRIHLLNGRLIFTHDIHRTVEYASPKGLEPLFSDPPTKSEICFKEFVRHDTLFRHGGYGYWSAHGELSYFNLATKNWELMPLKAGTSPTGIFNHFTFTEGPQWYFMGGESVSRKDPLELVKNQELWVYEPRWRKWSMPGRLNPVLGAADIYHMIPIQADVKPILFPLKGMMLVMDIGSKKVRYHRMSLTAESTHRIQNIPNEPGVFNGDVYCLVDISTKKQSPAEEAEYHLVRIPTGKFIGDFVKEEPLFLEDMSSSWTWLWVPFALLVIGIPYSFKKYSNKKSIHRKITLSGDRLVYRSVSQPIDPVSLSVLKLLLENPAGVPSSAIMDLVENPSIDFSQNTRTKIRVLENLNAQLRSILEVRKDIIITEKDPTDRRIKIYRLDRTFFEA